MLPPTTSQPRRPDLLIVGHITVDKVGDDRPTVRQEGGRERAAGPLSCALRATRGERKRGLFRLETHSVPPLPLLPPHTQGGAVSYAAVAARALGARACVVTAAAPAERPRLGEVFEGHRVAALDAGATLTFAHTYTWFGSHRKLHVTADPNVTLSLGDVPWACRRARAVLLGPLTPDDVDAASFIGRAGSGGGSDAAEAAEVAQRQDSSGGGSSGSGSSGGAIINSIRAAAAALARRLAAAAAAATEPRQPIGLMAQGFQRVLGPGGEVSPLAAPAPRLLAGLSPRVSLFLSDVETDAWPAGAVERVAAKAARVLVTRGDKGADEYAPGAPRPRRIPAVKIAEARDTNGAGDTFAAAYMVALLLGDADPGAAAAWAASRAVMQPQSCKPRCAPALLAAADGGGGGGAQLARRVTAADRARLAAAALLARAGLEAPARALERRGGAGRALEAGLRALLISSSSSSTGSGRGGSGDGI